MKTGDLVRLAKGVPKVFLRKSPQPIFGGGYGRSITMYCNELAIITHVEPDEDCHLITPRGHGWLMLGSLQKAG